MLMRSTGGAVSVRFFMPSPELAPYVSTYYLIDFALADGQPVEDRLHPEWANLRLTDGTAWQTALGGETLRPVPRMTLTGPTSKAGHFRIEQPMRVWGIGLLPLGWLRLFKAPATAWADRVTELGGEPELAPFAALHPLLFGGAPDPVSEAGRIDAHMLTLLAQHPPHEDEARLRQAHALLVDGQVASVGELAERLGVSARSLERLSARAFGFAPKLLLRRQRFLRSLGQFMLDPSLTWIRTLDWHYADQAHFVRDFQRFMAMSPSCYAALDHPVLRAAAQARAAAAGAPVQVLHRP